MAKESKIQSDTIGRLTSDGWFVFKVAAGPFQVAGMPDILAWKNGKPIGLEMKKEGGKASKLQGFTLNKMASHGVTVGTPYSVEEAMMIANMVSSGGSNRYHLEHTCLSCRTVVESGFRCKCGGHIVIIPRSET